MITTVEFTPVRLREGYDMGQVDDLLDELAAAVAADQPLATLVSEARFTPVRMREGYDMGEVDDFLQRVVTETGGGARPAAAPGRAAPAAYTPPPGVEGVIKEQRGLLARIFGRR